MLALLQQAIITMRPRSSCYRYLRSFAGAALLGIAVSLQAADYTTLKLFGKWASPDNARMGYSQQTGQAVACNEKWAVIGACAAKETAASGAAQVFNAQTGAWVRTLLPPSNAPATSCFGSMCTVIGNTALIGAPDWSKTSPGAVHVFDLNTGKLLRTLTASDGAAGDYFGCSIAAEGTRALIGAWGDDGNRGAVYMFDFAKGLELGKLVVPGGMADEYFGVSCAFQGEVAWIGAPGYDSTKGAAFIFDLQNKTKIETVQPVGLAAGAYFGWSVAFCKNKLVASAPQGNGGKGALYVRRVTHTATGMLTASDGAMGDQLGMGLAVHGDMILAGAPLHDSDRGKVYMFDLTELNAQEVGKITPPDPVPGNGFGQSLALYCGTLVAAAPYDSTQGVKTGAGYLFRSICKPMTLSKLTAKGDFAPGDASTSFNTFGDLTNNKVGQVAVTSSLTGANSNGGKDTGVWSTLGGGKILELGLKSRTVDGGATIDKITGVLVNYPTQALFRTKLKGMGVNAGNDQAIYTDNGAAVSRLFRTGSYMPQFPSVGAGVGAVPSSIKLLCQSRWTNLFGFTCTLKQGVNGTTASSDSGLLMASITNDSFEAVREGAAAGATGLTYGQFTGRLSYYDEYAVYSAAVAGAPAINAAIFSKKHGAAEVKLAQKGDTVKNFDGMPMPGTVYSGFIGESIEDQDLAAWRATINGAGVTPANNEGIWSVVGGGSKLVLRKGQDLGLNVTGFNGQPSLAGIRIAKFKAFWPTWNQMMVLVQLNGAGVTSANDQALLLMEHIGSTNKLRVLVREGQIAPGCGQAVVSTINRVEVEPYHTNYLVLASLKGGQTGTDLGLFQGSAHTNIDARRLPYLVLRKGHFSQNQPGRVKSLSLPLNNVAPSGAGTLGLGVTMSEQGGSTPGTVILPVTFENGVQQVMYGTL